jgi:hypothetical protein
METLRLVRAVAHEPDDPTPPAGGPALPHPTVVVAMTEALSRRFAAVHPGLESIGAEAVAA